MNINTGHLIKLLRYYKSILALIIVLILSLLPAEDADKIKFIDFPYFDKVIHFFMYLLLSVALLIDIHNNKKKPTILNMLLVLTVILIFSGIIEIIQKLLTDSRSGSFYDLIANFFGIIIAYFLYNKTRILSLFLK